MAIFNSYVKLPEDNVPIVDNVFKPSYPQVDKLWNGLPKISHKFSTTFPRYDLNH
jgi:hypothetical protein